MAQEYKPTTEEEMVFVEGTVKEVAEVLKEKFQPGEFYRRSYRAITGTQPMQAYVDSLQRAGLDIGKGDTEFGYRMPLPERDATDRFLVIFRR